jgi:hypothetical protein
VRTYNRRSYHLALWPTVLVSLALRSLVPGDLLLLYGLWFLPGMAALHVSVHILFAWRRARLRKRYGLTKFFSHLAFLLFFLFQIETSRGASHPVIIWLLHEIIGFQLGDNALLHFPDAVFNGLNVFLAGLLLFSYYNMLIETWQVPYAKRLADVLEEQQMLERVRSASPAHTPEHESESGESAEEIIQAAHDLHRSRLRVHLPSETRQRHP